MYSLIEKMATANLSVDQEKLTAPAGTSSIVTDFCVAEPYIEAGLNFGINAIKNPIAKWILELALTIVMSINAEFCPVTKS